MESDNDGLESSPEYMQWVKIDWQERDIIQFFDDIQEAIESFGLHVYEQIMSSGGEYIFYVTNRRLSEDDVLDIQYAVSDYWHTYKSPPDDEEDYGLDYPWREVYSDSKLDPSAIDSFKRAVEFFDVHLYSSLVKDQVQFIALSRQDMSNERFQDLVNEKREHDQ